MEYREDLQSNAEGLHNFGIHFILKEDKARNCRGGEI